MWFTVRSRMNVSPSHVYDLVREGAIASQRHGRIIRITRDALAEYLKDAERGKVSDVYSHLT